MTMTSNAVENTSPMNDGDSTNPSANPHIDDIIAVRMSRRGVLKGGIAVTATTLLGGSLSACGGSSSTKDSALALNFDAVAKNKNDIVTVPAGYEVSILHALGDPLTSTDAVWADNGSESADSYNNRIGDGHDGMHYFGLSDAGAFQANRSDRGLICVNHEYVVGPFALHPAGRTVVNNVRTVAAEVDKEINAHGVSVAEIRRGASGTAMSMVRGSTYNRRITSATPMAFSGPARGNSLVQTKFSPAGTDTRGTNNNCGNGYTPWGTYLTCEENFTNVIARAAGDNALRSAKEVVGLNRYGMTQGRRSPYLWDTAGSDDLYARWSASVTGASATADYRNIFNTFGWIVEIDPFAPTSTPLKHSALGRFAHEGLIFAPVQAGKPLVCYSGDDSQNEYIYKYVSRGKYLPWLRKPGRLLDEGTLYVARFNADGSGNWLALDLADPAFQAACSAAGVSFADQGEVLINTRLAADIVGATKMDRPEWGAVNPDNGEVYFTLTNNSSRTSADAANPRAANPFGHIIRWRENRRDHAGKGFNWDIFLLAGPQGDSQGPNGMALDDRNILASPDGLWFDPNGRLWIQTDMSGSQLASGPFGNNQMLVADPRTGEMKRFLVGPIGAEVTGISATPDFRTLFVNIQHPGEGSTPSNLLSTWPDGPGRRPRSATVVISREDGKRLM